MNHQECAFFVSLLHCIALAVMLLKSLYQMYAFVQQPPCRGTKECILSILNIYIAISGLETVASSLSKCLEIPLIS